LTTSWGNNGPFDNSSACTTICLIKGKVIKTSNIKQFREGNVYVCECVRARAGERASARGFVSAHCFVVSSHSKSTAKNMLCKINWARSLAEA
jgi:hypothetical protein